MTSGSGRAKNSSEKKNFRRLSPLAPGSIRPQRWLKQWVQINADGWLLDYAREKSPHVYGKFWNRNTTSRVVFDENNQTLTLCDYTSYFADGMVHYAAMCPDSDLAAEVEPWIEKLLASQDEDGYFGAFIKGARFEHWLEVLSQALVVEALLFRYQATGEKALLTACERVVRLQMKAWQENHDNPTFSGHGVIIVRSLGRLYELTGEDCYLQFAKEVLERHGMTATFLKGGDALSNKHDVIGSEHVGFPALVYEYANDPDLLEASRRAWEMMMAHHISVDGTPHGNEAMVFKGPLHNCEHCGTVDWFLTCNALARITGEVKYADAAERAIYNAYPAAKSVDGKTVCYMHTPNQLVASEWSQPHAWTSPDWCASRQHYHSAHEPLCCNANGPRGLVYFVEAMVATADDGLSIVYYGPCDATTILPAAGTVSVRMETDYPFNDTIALTITPKESAEFPVRFRIPEWASGATVCVNSQNLTSNPTPGSYYEIRRTWHPGDRIDLQIHCEASLVEWPRGEFGLREKGVAIQRGPLTLALPVKEDWQRFDPPASAPTQAREGVVAYRVLPTQDAVWNYAICLDEQNPERSLKPVSLPAPSGSRPWEFPHIGFEVKARRIQNWLMEGDVHHPKTPLMPYTPMELATDEEIVTLVPFGFTHLRITYLPVVHE